MKLIIKTKVAITKSGNKIRYAIFLCPYCLQEIERQISNGLRNKSCGCQRGILISKQVKGRKRTEEQNRRNSEAQKGKKLNNITKQKIRESISLENHWNWQNGKSFEKYGIKFNKELKQFILERDNYTCQCPDCENRYNILQIHHIDYNKKNNNPKNLITLCVSCHIKTNYNRLCWVDFYQNIIINKLLEK